MKLRQKGLSPLALANLPIPSDVFTREPIWVPLDRIEIHPAKYPRDYDEERARKIARNWQPALFNPPKLSPRIDKKGHYYCWDGQHGVGALKILGGSGCYCIVETLSVEEQAEFFREGQKSRKNLTLQDDFHAAVIQGDPVARGVMAMLASYGYYIPRQGHKGKDEVGRHPIRTVTGVNFVMKAGPQHFKAVLDVITTAWDWDPDTVALPMLKGVSLFLRTYPEVDRAELARKLAKTVQPRQLLLEAQAQKRRTTLGYDAHTEVAKAIVRAYNKNRKESARLDEAALTGARKRQR